MTDTSIEHVVITCTVALSAPLVDAGSGLGLTVRATCDPYCDLEGEVIEIRDASNAVVATGTFGAYDEASESNSTGEITVTTPLTPGDYQWSAHLAAHADEDVAYDAVTVPVVFSTKAHTTSLLVWDVPTAIVAGQKFRMKVGVKCSSGCRQAHRPFTIVDHTGKDLASAEAGGEIWPKSAALYFTELEVKAPKDVGLLRWEARSAETEMTVDGAEAPLAHTAGVATFDVRTVKRPDHTVRIEAWDGEKQEPLPGARVVLHPYGATTDADGVAEIAVATGDYRLFVSRTKYTTHGTPVTITGDLKTRIELFREPPPNRE